MYGTTQEEQVRVYFRTLFVLFIYSYVLLYQFGWKAHQFVPEAVSVLDTQDLHFLRRARQAALKEGWSFINWNMRRSN